MSDAKLISGNDYMILTCSTCSMVPVSALIAVNGLISIGNLLSTSNTWILWHFLGYGYILTLTFPGKKFHCEWQDYTSDSNLYDLPVFLMLYSNQGRMGKFSLFFCYSKTYSQAYLRVGISFYRKTISRIKTFTWYRNVQSSAIPSQADLLCRVQLTSESCSLLPYSFTVQTIY